MCSSDLCPWPVDTLLDDSPLNPPVHQLDSSLWQPKDYDDTTLGLIPMRQSLYLSRNLSTIKLGMSIGEQTVIGEVRRWEWFYPGTEPNEVCSVHSPFGVGITP